MVPKLLPPSKYPLCALPFDSWSESPSESLSSGEPAKNNSPVSRFAIFLRGMARASGWEDYPCVAGGIFMLVGADGNYFRDGTEPFIAIFLGFWAISFWPQM